MKKLLYIFISLFTFSSLLKSCVEPFDNSNISYENFLIVEGRLTNEFKKHKISLSRTIQIDSIGINPEKNAVAYVIDDASQIFNYSEIEDGIYQSNISFIPDSNKTYTLKIETPDGEKYSSTAQQLTEPSNIDEINIQIETNTIDIEELNIKINSSSSNTNNSYYFYEYEESFKIVAPYWSGLQFEISDQ